MYIFLCLLYIKIQQKSGCPKTIVYIFCQQKFCFKIQNKKKNLLKIKFSVFKSQGFKLLYAFIFLRVNLHSFFRGNLRSYFLFFEGVSFDFNLRSFLFLQCTVKRYSGKTKSRGYCELVMT